MAIGEKVKSAIEKAKFVFVATSNNIGSVHLAVSKTAKVLNDNHVIFEDWFCHKTLENLGDNPQIAIGVMDPITGKGYQLIGEVEKTSVTRLMNGFAVDKEEEWSQYPQSRHELSIRVDAIVELNTGPHSDEEIE